MKTPKFLGFTLREAELMFADYTIEIMSWTISSPGKFEGEPPWAVVAYQSTLDGCWDEDYTTPDTPHFTTNLDEEDITAINHREWQWLGLKPNTVTLHLVHDDQGFIYASSEQVD